MVRTVAAIALLLYSLVIARLTLADPSASSWAFALADQTAAGLTNGRLDWSQTEALANVALFIPAGMLLAVVLNSAWISAALCVALSALIEYVQLRFLPLRVPSSADIVHNGYGAALGAALAVPWILWTSRSRSSSYQPS